MGEVTAQVVSVLYANGTVALVVPAGQPDFMLLLQPPVDIHTMKLIPLQPGDAKAVRALQPERVFNGRQN